MADEYGVYRYKAIKDFILFDSLMSEGEVLIIQYYDPVNGRAQRVFDCGKNLLGTISSKTFYELKDKYIETV